MSGAQFQAHVSPSPREARFSPEMMTASLPDTGCGRKSSHIVGVVKEAGRPGDQEAMTRHTKLPGVPAGVLAVVLAGLFPVTLQAQPVSAGGAFLPIEDYVTAGSWTWRNATPFRFEGSTDDAFETSFAFNDPTADVTATFPDGGNTDYAVVFSALTTNELDVLNSVWLVSNGIRFEGATANAFETTLASTDVGADVTGTIPGGSDAAFAFVPSTLTTNDVQIVNSVWGVSNGWRFEGATADGFETTVSVVDPTIADATFSFPDAGGVGAGLLAVAGCTFTEDASSTVHTCTVEIPAGGVVVDISFTSTVVWGDSDAGLIIGDDDDDNGWFTDTDLAVTQLLAGELLRLSTGENWGGNNGAYLTTAGRFGALNSGESGGYYGAVTEVIAVVSVATPGSTTGRSFFWVTYTVPTLAAATLT